MSSLSDVQVQQLRIWLSRHGFKPERKVEPSPSGIAVLAQYSRSKDNFKVRIVGEISPYSVGVRSNKPGADWLDFDDLVSQRTDWPEAPTTSAIHLATLSEPCVSIPRKNPGAAIYRILRPWAYLSKVILQMGVGIGAAAYLGWYVYQYLTTRHTGFGPDLTAVSGAVNVIAFALAVAAGIELAYTLFTPGPDEALNPLMLGISSGILLLVTTPNLPPLLQFFGVLLGVLALGALFLIRRHLVNQNDD